MNQYSPTDEEVKAYKLRYGVETPAARRALIGQHTQSLFEKLSAKCRQEQKVGWMLDYIAGVL